MHGRVVDGSGRAVADAMVIVEGDIGFPEIALVSDIDGYFALDLPEVGRARLVATVPDGRRVELELGGERPDAVTMAIG